VAERDGFSAEIVVIDDASTDRTAEVAREHGARVVRLCRNLGIGGAVQTGLRLACARASIAPCKGMATASIRLLS